MPHQVTASHQALNGAFDSSSFVNINHKNSSPSSTTASTSSITKWKEQIKSNWIYAIMTSLFFIVIIVLVTILLTTKSSQQELPPCLTPTCIKEAARILNSIDERVSPCHDFYQFSCGQWIDSTVIPEHKSSMSSFEEVQDELTKRLRVLIEEPSQPNEPDFVVKAKNLYKSCMNLTQIELQGDQPLIEILTKLGGWPVLQPQLWNDSVQFSWQETYYQLRQMGLSDDMLLSVFVYSDEKNNSRRIIYIDQASLGLFDRDLLLKGIEDPSVAAYYKFMVDSAILLGAKKSDAEKQMQEVLDFEMNLANHSLPKEELRNMSLLYNKITIDELTQVAPNTNWLKLINNFLMETVTPSEEIVLVVPSYIRWLDLILPQIKPRILANYIVWRIVYSKTSYLSKKWRQLDQEFDLILYGKQRTEPRWDRCIDAVQGTMGKALSNLYVKNYFSQDNKKLMMELIENIRIEFLKILDQIDWMKDQTLKNAKEKAKTIRPKIGYPDELLDDENLSKHYRNLKVVPDNYFENSLDYSKWSADYEFSLLRQPNDKNDWRKYADVAQVNAYYYPQDNTIAFPAGILQGIFFNKNRPNYLNYGAIGEVAGHEITHGFDDTGRQYNKEGDVHNWWDDQTDYLFKKKSQCIINQYGNYTVAEVGLNLNGINTQGENIADNGGIKQAFRAYKSYVNRNGPEPPLPGLKYTPEQLFWISFGIQSCSKESKEFLKLMIEIDVHCPSKYRIIGALSNSKEFAETFNCPIGSPMNPAKKCSVW